jgi:hypothetical protein
MHDQLAARPHHDQLACRYDGYLSVPWSYSVRDGLHLQLRTELLVTCLERTTSGNDRPPRCALVAVISHS